jgi:hypothetical protein
MRTVPYRHTACPSAWLAGRGRISLLAVWALVFGLAGALAATLHRGYDLANAV